MIFLNLSEFKSKLDKFGSQTVPNKRAELARRMAVDLVIRIIDKTPVKTGFAKANWQVTSGLPAESLIIGLDPSGTATKASCMASIQSADMRRILWITNNAPYIHLLEKGSSVQAPFGMVRVSLAEIREIYST